MRAKLAQAVAICLGQRLRLGRVAGSLLAALGVVEAEGELGSMPRAGNVIQHGRLPGKVVRDRPALPFVHASAWPCAAQLLRMARGPARRRKEACECFFPDAPFSSRRSGRWPCHRHRLQSRWHATAPRWGENGHPLPSSLTEPIIMGTFFETSGRNVEEGAHVDDPAIHGWRSSPRAAGRWLPSPGQLRPRLGGLILAMAALPAAKSLAHSIFCSPAMSFGCKTKLHHHLLR